MSDHPFSEPDKDEPTVIIRPTPGGSRGPARPSALPPPLWPDLDGAAPASEAIDIGPTGQSALVVAATPLLQVLGRLRNTFNPPDPGDLRARIIQAVRSFETAARAASLPHEAVHCARYVLCASIDDVVLHTPWGAASPWVQASLVSTFHQEVLSGENVFHQLAALKREPSRNLLLLELIYLCLSLGYQGQYRLERNGPAQLDLLREDLYKTIVVLRGPYEQALSPHWKGIEAPYGRQRFTVPVWVMAAVVTSILGLSWFGLSLWANAASDRLLAEQVPPTAMLAHEPLPKPTRPPPPPPPEPERKGSPAAQALRQFLDPQAIEETPQSVRVRIFSAGMFDTGSDVVQPAFRSQLERIGEALNEEAGDILISGHTDNQPINRSPRFKSNYELSVARANAARALIVPKLKDPARVTTEGQADWKPLNANADEKQRAENRRIEIVLQRKG